MTKKQALPDIRRLYPIGDYRSRSEREVYLSLMKLGERKSKLSSLAEWPLSLIHKCVPIFSGL